MERRRRAPAQRGDHEVVVVDKGLFAQRKEGQQQHAVRAGEVGRRGPSPPPEQREESTEREKRKQLLPGKRWEVLVQPDEVAESVLAQRLQKLEHDDRAPEGL